MKAILLSFSCLCFRAARALVESAASVLGATGQSPRAARAWLDGMVGGLRERTGPMISLGSILWRYAGLTHAYTSGEVATRPRNYGEGAGAVLDRPGAVRPLAFPYSIN